MADRIAELRALLAAPPSLATHYGVAPQVALDSLPLLLDVAEAARWARDHISATPHGDNCHLTDEGDGAGCRCGKESMLDHLDTALAALEGVA